MVPCRPAYCRFHTFHYPLKTIILPSLSQVLEACLCYQQFIYSNWVTAHHSICELSSSEHSYLHSSGIMEALTGLKITSCLTYRMDTCFGSPASGSQFQGKSEHLLTHLAVYFTRLCVILQVSRQCLWWQQLSRSPMRQHLYQPPSLPAIGDSEIGTERAR